MNHPQSLLEDIELVTEIRHAPSLEHAFAARNRLTIKYHLMAKAVAARHVPRSLSRFREDAEQEAACALLEMAARYPMDCSVPFHAYAYGAMVNRVRGYLRYHSQHACGERLGRNCGKIRRFAEDSQSDLEALPDSVIAAGTGLSCTAVRSARPWVKAPVGLDLPGSSAVESELVGHGECVRDRACLSDDSSQLRALLVGLDPVDRYLVCRVYGLDGEGGASVSEAAAAAGFSGQRGSVRIGRALQQLRRRWRR